MKMGCIAFEKMPDKWLSRAAARGPIFSRKSATAGPAAPFLMLEQKVHEGLFKTYYLKSPIRGQPENVCQAKPPCIGNAP